MQIFHDLVLQLRKRNISVVIHKTGKKCFLKVASSHFDKNIYILIQIIQRKSVSHIAELTLFLSLFFLSRR